MKTVIRFSCALSLLVALGVSPAAAAPQVDATGNIRRTASFPYEPSDRSNMDVGGSDLAFDGRYVYAAEQGREGVGGGLHIYDAKGKTTKKMSFLACGGWQNDVAVVRKGLVAIGYHKGKTNCGSEAGGITLIDVRDPRRPKLLGSTPDDAFASADNFAGVHTITQLPGSPYLYASPGGVTTQESAIETVVDVSDPKRPVVAARIDLGIGCHDLTFWTKGGTSLGFCSGWGATQVWNMKDPLEPKVLASIVNPLHYFQHSSAVSRDGKLLVIGTETFGNDCAGGPTGALLVYDITSPAQPSFKGFFGSPRGSSRVYGGFIDMNFETLCAAHLFNFVGDSHTLVSGNGSGGVSVVDFSVPAEPKETAHYMSSDMPIVFSAYWHDGRVFSNGLTSFDVFDIEL